MLVTTNHIYSMAVSEQQAKAESRYNARAHYHNLGWDIVKKLPDLIDKPVAIIKSNTDNSDARFIVVTCKVDFSGRPIIVAVQPKGKGNYFNVEYSDNALLSGYGRSNFQNYIARAKTENRILYVRKNSQTTKNTTSVQFADNILSPDYSDSLTQFKEIVKEKFKGTLFENDGLPEFTPKRFSMRSEVEQTEDLVALHNSNGSVKYSNRTQSDASGKKITAGIEGGFVAIFIAIFAFRIDNGHSRMRKTFLKKKPNLFRLCRERQEI